MTRWTHIVPSERQVAWALIEGTRRYRDAVERHLGHRAGQDHYSLKNHIDGALGERVFGDLVGLEPRPSMVGIGLPDIGERHEVRTARLHPDTWAARQSVSLILHGHEPPHWVVVSCLLGAGGLLDFRGWLYAADGMNERSRQRAVDLRGDRKAGYFVHPSELRPMESMPMPSLEEVACPIR